MDDRIVEIWPHQFCLVSHTICYAELINHKKIDSLANFRDIVNFVDFPCNLMTKYGHESGSIAISHLKAGIGDKNHLSKKIIQFTYFPYLHDTF